MNMNEFCESKFDGIHTSGNLERIFKWSSQDERERDAISPAKPSCSARLNPAVRDSIRYTINLSLRTEKHWGNFYFTDGRSSVPTIDSIPGGGFCLKLRFYGNENGTWQSRETPLKMRRGEAVIDLRAEVVPATYRNVTDSMKLYFNVRRF